MIDKIKNAIEGLKFLCECGEIGLTDEEKQPVLFAIRSLEAWTEVLNELNVELEAWKKLYKLTGILATLRAKYIIVKKLKGVEK